MLWYQFIDDKLQGNQLIGANIIGTPASVQLNWQGQSVLVNNVDIVGGERWSHLFEQLKAYL